MAEILPHELASFIERIQPAELLLPEDAAATLETGKLIAKRLPQWQFDFDAAQRTLTQQLGTHDLGGFGVAEMPAALAAAGALLGYVKQTQRAALPHIVSIQPERQSEYVLLDAVTRRNLELTETIRGETAPSRPTNRS